MTPDKPKKSFALWPWIVVGLLGGHAAIIIAAVTMAVGDPSFAVVPDYYDKAVNFDAYKADLEASRALGWTLTLTPEDSADLRGRRAIVASLLDRDGQPIAGAQIELYFTHLGGGDNGHVSFHAHDIGGTYRGTAVMPRGGRYQIDATATVGALRFVLSTTLAAPGPATPTTPATGRKTP